MSNIKKVSEEMDFYVVSILIDWFSLVCRGQLGSFGPRSSGWSCIAGSRRLASEEKGLQVGVVEQFGKAGAPLLPLLHGYQELCE